LFMLLLVVVSSGIATGNRRGEVSSHQLVLLHMLS
jgi:hypothetical protein